MYVYVCTCTCMCMCVVHVFTCMCMCMYVHLHVFTRYMTSCRHCALHVAQWLEHLPSKQCVVGSNPTRAALFSFPRKKSCLG